MLDDLRALVEFARAGSIVSAADRLFRTPSAVTRQLQRLEDALGAELLDRSVKPPRLNALGARVLERARDLLQQAEALKSLASSDTEPHGLLRVGLAHPLAVGTLTEPIRALTEEYPQVTLRLLSESTRALFSLLLTGELDVAIVALPDGKSAPTPLLTSIVATDRVEIVRGPGNRVDSDWRSLSAASWVLNPLGCFLRASLVDHMERAGFSPMIAAEIHNVHLQLAFVQSGYGLGLLPASFIARNNALDTVEVLRPPSFELHMTVAVVRAGPLGALERAVGLLERGVRNLFDTTDTLRPGTPKARKPKQRQSTPRKSMPGSAG